MAEVLGAVASASQLAVLTMGLLDTVRKIKGGSETLRRYQQQLQEVQVLSESISRNPLLQTPDVDFHTRSILASISKNNLERRLQRGWISRTCTFLYKDRDLVDFFIILDRQKSSLSLVIENIQSRALHQIQSDIRAMCTKSPPFEKPSTPPDSDDEKSPKSTPKLANARVMNRPSTNSPARNQADKSTKSPDYQTGSESNASQHSATVDEGPFGAITMALEYYERKPNFKGAIFYQNEAHDGVDMFMGATVDNKLVKDLKKPLHLNDSPDAYLKNSSTGRGYFNAGVQREFSKDEALSQDNYQPIYHKGIYHGNYGKAAEEGSAAPKMKLGSFFVYKDNTADVPEPASEEE